MVSNQECLVSIIIPNYNGEKVLRNCLQSLINQDLEKDLYEIVIVDNASNDNSLTIIEELKRNSPVRIKVVKLRYNTGYGNAINVGAKVAKCKYILATNNDIIFHPKYLKTIVSTLEETRKKDPRVVAAAGLHFYYPEVRCINYAGGILSIIGGRYRYYGTCLSPQKYVDYMKRVNKLGEPDSPTFAYTGFATGAAALIDRKIYLALGGFFEKYFAGVEEINLGYDIYLSGLRAIFVPTAILYHMESFTLGVRDIYSGKKIYWLVRGLLTLYHLTYPPIYYATAILLLKFFMIGLIILSIIKGKKDIPVAIVRAIIHYVTKDLSLLSQYRVKRYKLIRNFGNTIKDLRKHKSFEGVTDTIRYVFTKVIK